MVEVRHAKKNSDHANHEIRLHRHAPPRSIDTPSTNSLRTHDPPPVSRRIIIRPPFFTNAIASSRPRFPFHGGSRIIDADLFGPRGGWRCQTTTKITTLPIHPLHLRTRRPNSIQRRQRRRILGSLARRSRPSRRVLARLRSSNRIERRPGGTRRMEIRSVRLVGRGARSNNVHSGTVAAEEPRQGDQGDSAGEKVRRDGGQGGDHRVDGAGKWELGVGEGNAVRRDAFAVSERRVSGGGMRAEECEFERLSRETRGGDAGD
mmetsp:Transcript_26731/g.43444  ORF Transcript_26731/g.43444 Transcript_26731/m.43444 type:complete len:262 (-) Transcript_26731:481-1266(-)